MPKQPYNHIALSIPQQIDLLKGKGLIIVSDRVAEQWLSNISYFRFKHYSYSFKDYQNHNGNYIHGTTFDMVQGLYLFDRKLKIILFEALENIEIAVKTQLSNLMSIPHGPHWYTNSHHFISEQERRQIIRNAEPGINIPKVFNHAQFLENLEKDMEAPDEIFLQFYKRAYEPIYPPSWIMMEMITFGTLSLMFENLQPGPEKTALCEIFKLTKKHLVSWLHCFSFIRNKCAHHARLIYGKINFAPALPQRRNRQFLAEADQVDNGSLYAVLSCIQYMLSFCNNRSSFKANIFALIDTYPDIDYSRLGFTSHWREEAIWT